MTDFSSSTLSSRCSLTIAYSYSRYRVSSSRAASRRRRNCASSLGPRPRSRRSRARYDGGRMKMLTASSNWARTCAAPWTSTSRSRSTPCFRARSYSDRAVPYHSPWTSAHSRNSPASLIFWNAGRSTKWYSIPSFSPGRGLRVVCEIENCRRSISASARARTVDFPAPEGPDTTTRFGSRSLNVLHLLAHALDLFLERHHLVGHRRRRGLAADGVHLAGHLLREEVEPLPAGFRAGDGGAGLGDVAP